ncbi:calmodulin calcium-dependent NAD kinase-like isoform X2 [Cryptomeria japonica]|uniref:calmodulin calcium-dependent NAD kinase-like isoform X2 n=1 Tax=Cryptomeria japonica TaxID=3369 RepID=UPI0027DA07B2|nr:calmodulin calcium-dependent NAD kinase-like isoform X2 [Cryptomeria japonica]
MKNLKTKNVFSTLLQQFKAIGHYPNVPSETSAVVPMNANDRSPVLLLIGGGMGVEKSTVVKDILENSFWSNASKNALVVAADAFKETDVIYQALHSSGRHDLLEISELVHQTSINAAESLLVTALNEGRDVIFDGTMSWEPFVLQTIAMARDVHHRQYRRGPGYQRAEDGSVQEKYWEPIEDTDPPNVLKTHESILSNETSDMKSIRKPLSNMRKPYRIELVGVICDAHLAVVRGVRRAIMKKRAVRVKEQLKSIKRFAAALPHYCEVVDQVKIYSTNDIGGPTKIIGWKEGSSKLLVDPENIKALTKLASLNEDARSVYELYSSLNDRTELDNVMKDKVLSGERALHQKQLLNKIQSIETYLLNRNSISLTSSHSASPISSSDYI